jgi:hypothetical protein
MLHESNIFQKADFPRTKNSQKAAARFSILRLKPSAKSTAKVQASYRAQMRGMLQAPHSLA